jgi:translation initiation factor IF-2
MAKVRVYELAKDLNMTNRALLNKMKELKIEVKSHMSSLEDSDIKAVRQNLFGKAKQSTDVKVRPSVIRRRKRKVEKASASETDQTAGEKAEESQSSSEENKTVIRRKAATDDSGKAPKRPDEDTGVAETVLEKEEPDMQKAVDEKELPKPAAKPKIKKSEPAKIVKPIVEEPLPDAEEPKKAAAKEQEQEPEEETVQQQSELPKEVAEVIPEVEEGEQQALNQEPAAKAKKKKKKKKTTPAKIVRVVDPAVLKNIQKSSIVVADKPSGAKGSPAGANGRQRPSEKGPEADLQAVPPMNMADTDGGKRKKGGRKDVFVEDWPAGKRKQRKKKSVIEGDALYNSSRGRKKRGKKDTKGKKGKFQKTQITTPKAIKRRIKIDEAIELAELAKRMGIKANEMIAKLMTLGVMATVNQTIDYDTASLVAAEFDFEVEKASFEEEALLNVEEDIEDEGNMIARAPVVTIMGHVDHGKTSLLDRIRQSKITSGEAGGITQHIGAYNVATPNGGRVTFLDTPGHAAFTAMRSRGAQVTDIVILVVAADDGVMPQTIEAINHSKAANVPVVVAVNKMDKEGADPDRIMRELSEFDLLPEDWGGDVIFVKVSAKTGMGIDDLLEMVLLQSEVLELKANPDRKATGYVVESRLDTGRGAVATVLVKQGTLRDGDPVVCGLHSGRIRAMIDDSGERIEAAGPSTPAEIVGLTGVPDAGDEFIAVASDKDAKQIAGHRMQKQRAKELAKKSRANLEKMFENLGSAEVKELKLIVKADVHGSIEALNDSLKDLAKEEVEIKIVHSGAGTINESDVALASVSDAIIIGFNVRPTPQIRKLAKDENVDMRFYDIIYDVINDIKAALEGMMPSTFHEIIIGRAEVRDTFVVPKVGTIAGCQVSDGKVIRGKKVRLLREGVIKCDTDLSSLRRFKDDVKEVDQGFECGIGLEKYNDIKIGDVIECYEVEERKYQGD